MSVEIFYKTYIFKIMEIPDKLYFTPSSFQE